MTTLDLYCPTCRKVTRNNVFPNDMVPMSNGLREWGLYCNCGTSYSCAVGMKYDNAVKSALLDAYEASKMFWTDKERCNDEMRAAEEGGAE